MKVLRATVASVACLVTLLAVACGGRSTAAPAAVASRAAANPAAAPASPDPEWTHWAFLRRPLAIPRVPVGDTCPVSSSQVVSPAYGPALGLGPVYPLGSGIVEFQKGGTTDWAVWAVQKFALVSSAGYRGEVLVRGRALRGDRDVRFGDGPEPGAELRLPLSSNVGVPGEEPGWRTWVELIRISAPGCYVLQLDGLDFSLTVVFEAVEEGAASATPSAVAGR